MLKDGFQDCSISYRKKPDLFKFFHSPVLNSSHKRARSSFLIAIAVSILGHFEHL